MNTQDILKKYVEKTINTETLIKELFGDINGKILNILRGFNIIPEENVEQIYSSYSEDNTKEKTSNNNNFQPFISITEYNKKNILRLKYSGKWSSFRITKTKLGAIKCAIWLKRGDLLLLYVIYNMDSEDEPILDHINYKIRKKDGTVYIRDENTYTSQKNICFSNKDHCLSIYRSVLVEPNIEYTEKDTTLNLFLEQQDDGLTNIKKVIMKKEQVLENNTLNEQEYTELTNNIDTNLETVINTLDFRQEIYTIQDAVDLFNKSVKMLELHDILVKNLGNLLKDSKQQNTQHTQQDIQQENQQTKQENQQTQSETQENDL